MCDLRQLCGAHIQLSLSGLSPNCLLRALPLVFWGDVSSSWLAFHMWASILSSKGKPLQTDFSPEGGGGHTLKLAGGRAGGEAAGLPASKLAGKLAGLTEWPAGWLASSGW